MRVSARGWVRVWVCARTCASMPTIRTEIYHHHQQQWQQQCLPHSRHGLPGPGSSVGWVGCSRLCVLHFRTKSTEGGCGRTSQAFGSLHLRFVCLWPHIMPCHYRGHMHCKQASSRTIASTGWHCAQPRQRLVMTSSNYAIELDRLKLPSKNAASGRGLARRLQEFRSYQVGQGD